MNFRNWGGLVLSAVLLTGCATGRNYQTDIDALNARISALQGQLAEKDQQVATLQTQLTDQQMAREAAESALRNADNERRALAAKPKASAASDLK